MAPKLVFLLVMVPTIATQDSMTTMFTTTTNPDVLTQQTMSNVSLDNMKQLNMTSFTTPKIDISPLTFQLFARGDNSVCSGNFSQKKIAIQPSGRTCEFLIQRNTSDICWVQIELKNWLGECTRNWLEADGKLECGDLKGERWLELPERGIRMRAASDRGNLRVQQVPCKAPQPLNSFPNTVSPSKPPQTQTPVTLSPSLSSPSVFAADTPLLTLPNNDRYGSDPTFSQGKPCNSNTPCQDFDSRGDTTYSNYPFNNFNSIGNVSHDKMLLSGDRFDPSQYPPMNTFNYAPFVPNSPPYPMNTGFRNPYLPESSLTISNPGYPNQSPPGDCVLDLPLPSACNIIFRFVFFDVGQGDPSRLSCTSSWLELAGYRFCGCQTGLMWSPPPESRPKGSMRLVFHGVGRFLLDIIFIPATPQSFRYSPRCSWQCEPRPYYTQSNPGIPDQNRPPTGPQVRPPPFDTSNQYPPTSQFPGINPTQFRPDNYSPVMSSNYPQSFNGNPPFNRPVGYIPSSNYAPGQYDYPRPSQKFPMQFIPPQNPNYPSLQPYSPQQNGRDTCNVVTSSQGYLYPDRQGHNVCYRFSPNGRNDNCGTAVELEQLHMGESPGCKDEFISFGRTGPRYCGNNIPQKPVMMDRDDCFYARISRDSNFRARYRSLECGCDAAFREQEVAIRGPMGSSCSYKFLKYNPTVCGLEVILENLNLDCAQESLHLGGQYYCGNVFKKIVRIDFLNPSVEIKYYGPGNSRAGSYMIIARQLTNCPPPVIAGRNVKLDDKCIVPLTRPTDSVQSPLDGQTGFSTCTYQFIVPSDVCWVRINFNEFNIPWTVGCQESFIKIDAVKYCGNQLQNSTKVLAVTEGVAEAGYEVGRNAYWTFMYSYLPCRLNVLARSS